MPGFKVGVLAIVRDEAGAVLLVRHSYDRDRSWRLPGGWMERGESPQGAVARELLEEMDLRVEVGAVCAAIVGKHGQLTLAFHCRPLAGGELRLSAEVKEARYFERARLPVVYPGSLEVLGQAWPAEGDARLD